MPKTTISPHTKPDGAMREKIKANTKYLFANFSAPFLAEKASLAYSTVNTARFRNKLAPQMAHDFAKIKEVKSFGITREFLRPDIINWYVD
ncbi:MAG: hypothetical protein V4440_08735 [Pseudomonadota bacterium]